MSDLLTDPKRRRWMRVRMVVLALCVGAGALLVSARAWELTIQHGPALRAMAESQQLRDIRLAPKRGTIYDRHGAELAVSVDVESVFANPRLMRAEGVDTESAATRLANLLGVDRARIAARLRSDRYFVWIERQVTPTEAAAVRALGIEGVQMTDEARRFYPNRELASHLLGFANIDGVGIEGLELALEDRLRGSVQPVPAVRDRRGRVVFSDQLLDDRAAQGDDVFLTIDKTIQHITERELALGVRTAEAAAGSVVVMDPRTGEILAMANYPTFNPNEPGRAEVAHRRNRAVTDRFEPGSTVKPFTLAAAFAANVVHPEEAIDCEEDGQLEIGEDTIGDGGHRFGIMTPAQILARSSNIGTAKIGMRLGRRGLFRSFRRFGFGEPTGVELPGETGGILRHHTRWYDLDLATISFGQGMSTTTLQLATAMSTIANGGRLMHPHILRRTVDSRGATTSETLPRVRRQVIPRRTARLIADMLTAVTGQGGTGPEAAIDGYLVAGKTGTAQKADYRRGGYQEDVYIASFVGFVPAQDPALVIAVVIDEPVVDHYGGTVAGPIFRRIGEASLRHLGVPADTGGEALAELERRHRQRERERRRAARGEGAAEPETLTAVEIAVVPEREPRDGEVMVPDLTGLTARGSLGALRRIGLDFQLEGSGLVVAQSPQPGAVVDRGSEVRVILERPELRPEADVPVTPTPDGTLAQVTP
ncbi:MAG TPA: peptidoglycan glycosyltransferase [Myxococcales bacterium]|nr:peptidoglycan glycosyltransferase [Myxococcales bacterium]